MVTETTTARPPKKVGVRKSNKSWGFKLAPYLFVFPNMLIFGLFTIYPAINGVNISLYESPNGRVFRWVGAGNYTKILSDSEFWSVAKNTAYYALAYVILSVILALLLAVLVDQQKRGKTFFRGAFFVPVLISPVVVGLVWSWMLERRGGLVNSFLSIFGIEEVPWLVDSKLALIAVIGVGVWMQVGFYMLIILAGLQAIDPTLYEAAGMDGANKWTQFRMITLPLVQPSLLVVVILGIIHGFQAFDFIFTLTGGGPVGATMLIVQYIYENGFTSPVRYGIAAAAGVILFVVIFALTIFNWFVSRDKEEA